MAASNYAPCLVEVLKWEGGYVNHPSDPGGETNKGVTKAVYDAFRKKNGLAIRSVKQITEPELQAIYRTGYWNVVNGDNLAPGVDLATFDFGVNSGPSRAIKYLKSAAGGTHDQTVKKLCAARLTFVRGLGTFKVFGKGWVRRINAIEAKGVSMALAAMGWTPSKIKTEMQKDAVNTNKKVIAQGTATTGTATAGTQVDVTTFDPTNIIVAAIVVGALAFLAYRMWVNKSRANAYMDVANELG